MSLTLNLDISAKKCNAICTSSSTTTHCTRLKIKFPEWFLAWMCGCKKKPLADIGPLHDLELLKTFAHITCEQMFYYPQVVLKTVLRSTSFLYLMFCELGWSKTVSGVPKDHCFKQPSQKSRKTLSICIFKNVPLKHGRSF